MMMGRIIAVALTGLLLAGCTGNTNTPATVTVTQPPVARETTTETTASVVQLTVPDVTGQNAEIAREHLEDMGFTEVSLSSANPKYSVVVLATNWTVVSIEPGPGTVVNSDDQIVVKVYKD